MLQKIRRHKPFHSRNSLQTKGVLAFSGPHLWLTKLRPIKSSAHPYFADSFAFLLDVFCNIEVCSVTENAVITTTLAISSLSGELSRLVLT